MKMTSIVLLCCLFFLEGYDCDGNTEVDPQTTINNQDNETNTDAIETSAFTSTTTSTPANSSPTPKTSMPTSTPDPSPETSPNLLSLIKYDHLVMITGGLILICTVILFSTLLLACKVCQLSRRLKMLSSHSDLMCSTKYWKESTEKKENKSETDANETTVLMSDLIQTSDETRDGGEETNTENKKEEEDKVCVNGVEQKETGAKNEDPTPAAVTENASSPQEEGAIS